MKKRILAAICLLAVLLCAVVVGSRADAVVQRYQVGYAIKDMNPWLDYNDHSKGLNLGLFNLTGNGNDAERPLAGLFDDNGDGVQGEGDGLYTTATAVTDPYGKTIIYVTIDSLQGYSYVTADARTAIVEQLGSNVIAPEQIMVSGSHTHSGGYFQGMRTATGAKGAYYQYIVSQITAAAVEAYNDRAEAVMTKGTINAKESTAHLGYNNGKGFHMNAIRHYEVTISNKADPTQSKTYMINSGDGINKKSEYPYPTVTKSVVTTDTANNEMHVLKFDFPKDSTKEPIVLVNWRAHTTMNSGIKKSLLSSDYPNGLRTTLKKNGYRAAFLQGAAGNVVTCATESTWKTNPDDQDWRTIAPDKNTQTFIYGSMLAEIAMDCMERKMSAELPAGEIRNVQMTWHGDLQQDSEGLRAAAAEAKQRENNGETLEYPYRYTHTDGKLYIVNSNFHCNSINNRASAAYSYTNLELNSIVLGNSVAFVTAPNELADYFNEGSLREEENDWFDLINEESYGTPFVLGYTNGGNGYIANWMDHMYNTPEYYEITGYGKTGNEFFSPGTYESITSRFAKGEGERLIKTYAEMLSFLQQGERVAYCQACKKNVEWKAIIGAPQGQLHYGTGHYYLYNDLPMGEAGTNRISIKAGEVLCLDLNGHKIETLSRSVYMEGKGATLNLFDSAGGGKLISYTGGNNVGGGAVSVAKNTVLNIYSGAIQFIRKPIAGKNETGNGATVSLSGTLNMYGGTLIGGDVQMSNYYGSTSSSNGRGGTVFAYNGAIINATGGEILAGTTPYEGCGDCVYLAGSDCRVTVSGDAKIDEIYMNTHTAKQITIKGTFTGKLGIRTGSELATGSSLATLSSAKITNAKLTYTARPEYELRASGSALKLFQRSSGAAVVYENYQATAYDTVSKAVAACNKGLVTLLKNSSETLAINKDVFLDLNGCSITGNISVADGKTLYCMDSETDDFTVADGVYGKLTCVTGNVQGVSEGVLYKNDIYLMVTEEAGTSFHRVQLQLTTMSFRPEAMGLYYKSAFAGDEVVASHVDRFGVALSLAGEPNAENMQTLCKASWFTDFASGKNGNPADQCSTLLKGILKPTNSLETNQTNGALPIYGRAYILTKTGGYLFGHGVSRTLQRQLEDVNNIRSSLTAAQKKEVLDAYYQYADVMRSWDLVELLQENATNDGVLKILAIGDAFAVDSIHLLREVYAAEKPDQKVILGCAYLNACTLSEHVAYMNDNANVYRFYEIADNGSRKLTDGNTLAEIMQAENWDVVILQQGSAESGNVDTYGNDMTKLRTFAKNNLGYAPKYGWNMTWSYPTRVDANSVIFDQYGSQEAMFNAIASAVKAKIFTNTNYTYVMPVGLAVQNARTYYTERTDMHRDAYGYLNDLSRLMAAYVWYCELEAVTLADVKLTVIPETLTRSWSDAGNTGDMVLTEMQKNILLEAVNNAMASRKDGSLAVIKTAYK